MSVFLKAVSGVFISLILWLCLNKNGKEISVLLTLVICTILITSALSMVEPVINFINKLQEIGDVNKEYIKVVLKVVGIGLVSELSNLICKDAGNESMGKALQIFSSIIVLILAIPIFEKLLELITDLLGKI